jgi:hypothetical protein
LRSILLVSLGSIARSQAANNLHGLFVVHENLFADDAFCGLFQVFIKCFLNFQVLWLEGVVQKRPGRPQGDR